jgi:tripartite-type tricarboxylate transporter receptor subunit TctC
LLALASPDLACRDHRPGVSATNDLHELMAWLKKNSEKVSQAHNGAGGGQHLCGIAMQNQIGVRWQFVPYRGGAPAMQDLLGGQIDFMCTGLGSSSVPVREMKEGPSGSAIRC